VAAAAALVVQSGCNEPSPHAPAVAQHVVTAQPIVEPKSLATNSNAMPPNAHVQGPPLSASEGVHRSTRPFLTHTAKRGPLSKAELAMAVMGDPYFPKSHTVVVERVPAAQTLKNSLRRGKAVLAECCRQVAAMRGRRGVKVLLSWIRRGRAVEMTGK